MQKNSVPAKQFFSATEAAQALGISVTRLYMILDQNVFNDGTARPQEVTFQSSDLVLLGFWNRCTPNPKVVRMPKRD